MNYNLAKVLYCREYPEALEHDFYHVWHNPANTTLFEELRQKYGVVDILGNQIQVGDKIAYSINKERSALLFMYEVLEIKPDGKLKAQAIDMVTRWHTPTKASSLQFPESRAIKIM